MTTLSALFASPLTWMIFGATAQLSLAAWVRSPRSLLWAFTPLMMIACLVPAALTAGEGSPHAYQIGMGLGLIISAGIIASSAPAVMNGGIILAISTTFWIWLIIAWRQAWWWEPAAFIAAAPTAVIVAIAATGYRPDAWLRLLLYLWALFALIVIGAARFPYSDFAALELSGRNWIVILAASYLGAHLAMLVHNVLSLLLLVPYPSRLKEIRQYAARLSASYHPEPIGWRRAALIIGGQGAFVWLLSLWRPEGAWLAVQACLSLSLIASIFFLPPGRFDEGRLPTSGDIKRAECRRRRG